MKSFHTKMLLVCVCVASFLGANAQSAKDIFSADAITYLGVDFTKAKLMGEPAAYMPDVKNKHFPAISALPIVEPKKYKLDEYFHVATVTDDLSVSDARNAKISEDQIKSTDAGDMSRLTEKDIQAIAPSYKLAGKKGIGVVFIVEALSKTVEKGAAWVTYVDLATGKLLLTKRMEGKVGGFGFKNYYAKVIYNIMQDIKSDYKKWKAENG